MDKKRFGKREKFFIGGLILVIGICIAVYFYYSYFFPETDDAYVNANIVYISPQVSGEISQIMVSDHQAVQAGQILATIDQSTFLADLNASEANLAVAKAEELSDQEQVAASAANLAEAEAKRMLTQQESERTLALLSKGYISMNEADQARANLKSANAVMAANTAALLQAKQDVKTQQSQIKAAQASVQTAQLNLGYTILKAPVAGIISNFSLRPGMIVTANDSQFAIIDQKGFWVDANFEETQLKRIRIGQDAEVKLDMYPGVSCKGVVQSISAANGSTFSLLPAENATGNWVKVVQRFTVKVAVPESELTQKYPLRVGASAKVTINTH